MQLVKIYICNYFTEEKYFKDGQPTPPTLKDHPPNSMSDAIIEIEFWNIFELLNYELFKITA